MNAATRYRSLAVRHKLRLVVMATVTVALLFACAAVVVYDRISARNSMRSDLDVLAQMLGANSTAALSFDDARVETEILSTLSAKRPIVSAHIYTANGRPFANYHRAPTPGPGIAPFPPALRADGAWFEAGRLILFKSVMLAGMKIGTVYLESDLDELNGRLQRLTAIVTVILAATWLLALALASRLQGIILDPLAHLGRAAKIVTEEKRYSTRAVKVADDDLGQLTDAFNGMLAEIESRDQILLRHRDRLEQEVQARTGELVQLNANLRQSEAQFRSLVEGAPDAMFVQIDSRFAYVNAAACRLFGAESPEQLLGQSMMDRIHPSKHDAVRARIHTLTIQKEPTSTVESLWLSLDGQPIPVEVSAVPIYYHGKDSGLVFGHDITQRKNAEKALVASEQRYRGMLEAAPDAIVVVNDEGKMVLVNTQAERMFGRPREELLGQKFKTLFPEGCLQEHSWYSAIYSAHSQTRKLGTTSELHALRGDGSEFPVEISLSPVETGEGVLAYSAIRDVSERKRVEQRSRQLEIAAAEAEAANRAKSMFLSTMSHEIRTPMNAILGYSQLMLRDPHLGTDAKANLHIINRSGEHLLHIIDDVLDMAKIEAGRLQLSPIEFSLRSLLRDLQSMFSLRTGAKGIQFDVHLDGEPIESVLADEGKLRQVLINLLGNAVKFTERGRIHLQASLQYQGQHELWLSAQVEDTGLGLTAEEQSRLFQPFVQGEGGQRMRHGGTGLGLAISRGMVHLMGGEITVSSTPGQGSTFRFQIPVERGADLNPEKPSDHKGRVLGLQNGAGQDPPRILIADDVPDNREWLSKLLTALGFAVRTVENGEAAVQTWQEWRPNLILMDVHMPILDGLEASRCIKSSPAGKDTVIIALTADAREEHRRVALLNQMDDFISKPCQEGELLEKMRTHLGLDYLYEAVNGEKKAGEADEPAGTPKLGELSPEQLRKLPADLIQRLRDATFNGDKALLDQMIPLIEELGNAESARALQELVDTYQYDRLTELLEVT